VARLSIIDLGTNTFNLLVVETQGNQVVQTLHQEKIPVKLGEGGINLGVILDKPYQRGLEAMQKYAGISEDLQADKIFAFATSAIRSSRNGQQFANDVKASCGIEVQIIDGQSEAELIYRGVQLSGALGEKTSLILDIGGGSCEFILCNQQQVFWKHSFDLGVSRLFDRYRHHNPILLAEIQTIETLFETELQTLFKAIQHFPTQELIGSSGSFDTFAEMTSFQMYGEDRVSHLKVYDFNIPEFEKIHRKLLHSTVEERYLMKGLVAMRVDMIVIASILVNFLIHRLEINSMKVSAYSLKEGVMEMVIRER
jgi:exopolyphosphatase / guanosine-5'-triphosphate,3'-diphosphate pyrophosphatase